MNWKLLVFGICSTVVDGTALGVFLPRIYPLEHCVHRFVQLLSPFAAPFVIEEVGPMRLKSVPNFH